MKLIHGDALEALAGMDAGSVDAVVTDPPYAIGTPARVNIKDRGKMEARTVGGDFGAFDSESFDHRAWLSAAARVLKADGPLVSFCNGRDPESFLRAARKSGLEVFQDFHWIKKNPPVPMRSTALSWGVESGYVLRKRGGKLRHNDKAGISPNYVITPICGGRERTAHPTQKPISVMAWLVLHWTFPDWLVVDPFMGSGTTAVACLQNGRRFVGVEKDAGYFAIAERRLASTGGIEFSRWGWGS